MALRSKKSGQFHAHQTGCARDDNFHSNMPRKDGI
jgi:hypothetical protein